MSPSNLTASVSEIEVSLNWLDNSDNETVFLVERAVKLKGKKLPQFIAVAQVSNNITTYSEFLDYGSYIYRVRALDQNLSTYSNYSNEYSVKLSAIKSGGKGGRR